MSVMKTVVQNSTGKLSFWIRGQLSGHDIVQVHLFDSAQISCKILSQMHFILKVLHDYTIVIN